MGIDSTLSQALRKLKKRYKKVNFNIITSIDRLREAVEIYRATSLISEYAKVIRKRFIQKLLNKRTTLTEPMIEDLRQKIVEYGRSILELMTDDHAFLIELIKEFFDDVHKHINPRNYQVMHNEAEKERLDKEEAESSTDDGQPKAHDGYKPPMFDTIQEFKRDHELVNRPYQIYIKDAGKGETIDEEHIKHMGRVIRAVLRATDSFLVDTGTDVPVYRPVVAIVDDQVGSSELQNQNSDLLKLALVRRHYHLTMVIASQTCIALSTNLRRNTNCFVLLPSLNTLDINNLSEKIPVGYTKDRLMEEYYAMNTDKRDRNQQLITIFTVHPYHIIVNGAPPPLLRYYAKNK